MIAISYRREDSLPIAGRLYDRLQAEFGKGNVFMDFDSIPYGVDFREHIKQIIERSKLVVAMIGPDWMGKGRHRTRRIDDPADFVRLEITYALERALPVIPVLINDTPMPRVGDLPVGIEALAFRNGLTLDAGVDFHHHADRLIAGINWLLKGTTTSVSTAPKEGPPEVSYQVETSPATIEKKPEPVETLVVPATATVLPPAPPPKPPPVEPSRPPAETTPAEISISSAERLESTVKVLKESAPPTAPRKLPVIEPPKPAKSKPPSESRKIIKTPVPVLRADKAGRFARVKKLVTQLQDKVMADYVRPSRLGREQKAARSSRSQKRIALFGAIALLAIAVTAAGWYWEFRTPGEIPSNKKGSGGETPSGLLIENNKAESPDTTAKSEAAPTAAAVNKGMLKIDSTPQGLAYEIIDGASNHRTGTTPATLEDLPKGYAQVFYKGIDNEHHEMVWIEGGKTSSTRWTVPDKAPSPVAQAPVAPPARWVAPSMTPEVASLDRMNEFVRQFVETNDSPDVDRAVSFYAPNAEIFEEGRKSLDAIRRDIKSYNTRWPTRRDRIRGAVQMHEEIPNQQYNASFQQDYYVEDPARRDWIRGNVDVDLKIAVIDGSPKISSIKQKTLSREKGRGKGPGLVKNETPPASSASAAPSASSPPSKPPITEGPQKLVRVVNKQYGFFALVPAEVFPDAMHASDTGQTSFSTTKGRTNLNFFVRDNSDGETFKKLYQEWIAEHTPAQPNKKVHYKPMRDKWFVVSGIDGPRGFYVEAVKKGDIVVVMSFEYDENASPLTPPTLLKMSQIFKEN